MFEVVNKGNSIIKFIFLEPFTTEDMKKLEPLIDTSEKADLFAEAKGLYDSYISLMQLEFGFLEKGTDYSFKRYQEEKEGIVDGFNQKLRKLGKSALGKVSLLFLFASKEDAEKNLGN